ncbi:MAG: hypothetical protein ACE5ER_12975, partial [Nitrospinaceae bacterium]
RGKADFCDLGDPPEPGPGAGQRWRLKPLLELFRLHRVRQNLRHGGWRTHSAAEDPHDQGASAKEQTRPIS